VAAETPAFVFTDIEGSAALPQRLGEGTHAGLLAGHHGVMRSAPTAHGGTEVVMQADGFFAVFSSRRRPGHHPRFSREEALQPGDTPVAVLSADAHVICEWKQARKISAQRLDGAKTLA
jgi:class 3 adenylate cyclase